MTEREAREKIQHYGLRLQGHPFNAPVEWHINFPHGEWFHPDEYTTTSLEEAVSKALELAQKYGGVHQCVECGEFESAHYMEPTRQRLIAKQLCFGCDHWLNIMVRQNAKDLAIIDHWVYNVHDGVKDPRNKSHLGFGGRQFKIIWTDGRVKESNNVWCSGKIPERFWERMPDNAKHLDPFNMDARVVKE